MNAYAGQRNEQVRTPLSPPEELTSRVNSTDLTEILKNVLTRPFGDPKHVEVILATNMNSVGVDIPRLNLL